MATLTKLSKPGPAGYHTWNQSEFSAGDIIDIFSSLGRSAHHMTISCEGGEGIIRINVVRKIYKNQESVGNKFIPDAAFWRSPAFVGEVEEVTNNITINADTVWTWSEELAILDIKIIQASPLMKVMVS